MVQIFKKTINSADGYTLPYNQYLPEKSTSNSIILIYEIS